MSGKSSGEKNPSFRCMELHVLLSMSDGPSLRLVVHIQ